MASGNTNDGLLNLPYPVSNDPVNVHGYIEALVDRLKIVLPPLGLPNFQISVINNSGINLSAGTPVYVTGYTTKTTVAKATPDRMPILGLLKQPLQNGSEGICVVAGVMDQINTTSFTAGDVLYVSSTGGLTNSRPASGSGAVGVVAHAAVEGIIIVEAKGNGTWGALRDGLA